MAIAAHASDKRAHLVEAAVKLLHELGFQRTTLALVAIAAEVPLGNVYYYFKTKEALAEAVIETHEAVLRERFAGWERAHDDVSARLRSLVRAPLSFSKQVIQFGCPHGSLCQELEKLGPEAALAKSSARLLSVYLEWAASQFRQFGFSKGQAQAAGAELIAAIQGTMLLAHTLRSPELLERQLRRLESGLNKTLSESTSPRSRS